MDDRSYAVVDEGISSHPNVTERKLRSQRIQHVTFISGSGQLVLPSY